MFFRWRWDCQINIPLVLYINMVLVLRVPLYTKLVDPKELILKDQIFMTPVKLCHNYTHLHLAPLFHCSISTVRNVSITFIKGLFLRT